MQSAVNVSDFGAIGQALTTSGNVAVGSPDVTVNTISGWVVGAGVEVDAGAGDVFKARVTAVNGNILGLSAAPGFSATGAIVTNDDSVRTAGSVTKRNRSHSIVYPGPRHLPNLGKSARSACSCHVVHGVACPVQSP